MEIYCGVYFLHFSFVFWFSFLYKKEKQNTMHTRVDGIKLADTDSSELVERACIVALQQSKY